MKKFLKIIKNNEGFILFFVGMAFFRTAVADWNYVPSGSMEPNIYEGDYLWVDKMSYGATIPFTEIKLYTTGSPQRGDIITFYAAHTDAQLVKRVIGVPGDSIRIEGRQMTVNGHPVSFEPSQKDTMSVSGRELVENHSHTIQYLRGRSSTEGVLAFTVPEKRYFVMGDNRNNSLDSRYWGFVEEERVMGKATHVALSFSRRRPAFERFALNLE